MELLRRISTGRFSRNTRSAQAQRVALVSRIFSGEQQQQQEQDQRDAGDSDAEAVEILGRIFQGELEHLKLASPTVESSTKRADELPKTPAGGHSPSFKLYEHEYAEINRTMMSALALKWILHGDYEAFTGQQDGVKKLSLETFNELRDYFKKWLRTSDDVYDLVVALVTSDLGKDPMVLEQLKRRRLIPDEEANHDIVVYIAAQHDEFPTLAALPKARRQDIILGIKFAASVNIPQLVQAECVPGNLTEAMILKNRPRALALKCMEILLDVAGALGDRDVRGALTMTEAVVGGYKTAFGALADLLQGQTSLRECYHSILDYRKELLASKGFDFPKLNPPEARAYQRLLCMGRVDDSKMGQAFLDAFNGLEEPWREALIAGLNVDGVDDGVAVLPYYMPGLFSLGLRSRSTISTEALVDILVSLFRFLARMLGGTKPCPGQPGRIVERSVAFAKKEVGDDRFLTEPNILDEVAIPYPPISTEPLNGEESNEVTKKP